MSSPRWFYKDRIAKECDRLTRLELEELFEFIRDYVITHASLDAAIETYNRKKSEDA